MGRWTDRLNSSPVPWLLEKACPPIQYRTHTEILQTKPGDWDLQRAKERAYNYEPAVTISRLQQQAGTWLDKVLEFEPPNPSRKRGPGLVNQFLALVEYGWDMSHPILHCSGELLFRYLSEDTTAELYELNGYVGKNKVLDHVVRRWLMRASAALLVRAGSYDDPRITSYATRFLDEVEEQYGKTDAPDIYDGDLEIPEDGRYARLKPDAIPVEMFALYLMAFLPQIRSTPRGQRVVDRFVDHLFTRTGEPKMILEVEGKRVLRLRQPRIGDMTREDFAAQKLGFLLHDLELLARTGTLLTQPRAVELLDWVLSLQQPDGVFRPDAEIEKAVTPSQYHYFPLEDSWRGKHKKYTDVTFRVLLILTLLDRQEKA